MAEEVFEVNVYKPPFNPQRPDKNIIGTVKASYVPDGQGGYLTDKDGKRYLAPVGYDPRESFIYGANGHKNLLDWGTGKPRDLQRSFHGKSYGSFVPAFTPIASFDVGVACAGAAGVFEWNCKFGGGLVNLKNRFIDKNPNINIWGAWFNNPKNVPNIERGYDWGKDNMEGFGDMLMKRLMEGAENKAIQNPQPGNEESFVSLSNSLSAPAAGGSESFTLAASGNQQKLAANILKPKDKENEEELQPDTPKTPGDDFGMS